MISSKVAKKAFIKSLPVMVGYIVIGFGFGVLLRDAGYGTLWAFAMSLFIYAGSMQYVGVSLITVPATLFTTILTTIMINARHLFYSISMIKKYKNTGKLKPYLVFALTDETYALLSNQSSKEESIFYFLVSFFNHLYWIVGTLLGSVLATTLPFSTNGVIFSMTALFVAAYTQQWLSGEHRASLVIGVLSTLICLIVFGKDMFLIPSMVAIVAILVIFKNKISKYETSNVSK